MKRLLTEHVSNMHGYVYGEQPSDPSVIKLNTNENPYPASPAVNEALASLDVDALRRYPDATATSLRERIAERHGLSPEQVLITNGGDEAIRLLAMACLDRNAVMVSTEPGYSLYPVMAAIQNARWIPMELDDDFRLMEGAGRRCIQQQARLVCIPNPNAPSGVLLTADEVDAFASRFLEALLIDEAYVDFVEPDAEHDLVPLLRRHRHLLLLRTFSKGYSLAGARVGYLLGDADLIGQLSSKVRDSYNVNAVSQAIALAAFEDVGYASETWAKIRAERQRVTDALRNNGFEMPDSQANFVLSRNPGKSSMRETFERLRDQQIFVRYFDTPRLHDRLRITIGTPKQNDALLSALANS